MTRTLQLPDVRVLLRNLERRLSILERRIREQQGAAFNDETVFSLPEAVAASTSPKAYLRADCRMVNVVASLGTAGSSTTTVQVKKNGSTVVTLTLAASATFTRTRANVGFIEDTDYITVTVSAAGTGAKDLTVQARFA